MTVPVIIADDHPVVLAGLSFLIGMDPLFEIVAEAADGASALEAVRATKPDIAILDVRMPRLSGIEVMAAIRSEFPSIRAVLLTANDSDAALYDAVAEEPAGILLKEAAPGTLLSCLHVVAGGGKWPVSEAIRSIWQRESTRRQKWRQALRLLTRREAEIVDLAAKGLPNKTIAARLGMSEGTVKVHLTSTFRKLGVASRHELAEFAAAGPVQ